MLSHFIASLFLLGHASSSLIFHGCFEVDNSEDLFKELNDLNNNINCLEVCLKKHFPLFATSDKTCMCLDLFPEKHLALASEGDAARGESSRCNQKCPADAGQLCEGETCCGGPENAYTVYSTGNIEYWKKLLKNLAAAVFGKHVFESMRGGGGLQFKFIAVSYKVKMANGQDKLCLIQVISLVLLPSEDCGEDLSKTSKDGRGSDIPFVRFQITDVQEEMTTVSDTKSRPLSGFDLEFDNTRGNTDANMKRTRTVTETTSETYTTESGVESSYTVGASVSASFSAFGAEFSATLSADYSNSRFFNSGYSNTKSKDVIDSFEITTDVPRGTRKVARFSKKYVDRTLKWRSTIVAEGRVNIAKEDGKRNASLSEFLEPAKRRFYGYGTIKGEAKAVIAVAIESYDEQGRLVDVRQATKKEVKVVATSRKRGSSKFSGGKKPN